MSQGGSSSCILLFAKNSTGRYSYQEVSGGFGGFDFGPCSLARESEGVYSAKCDVEPANVVQGGTFEASFQVTKGTLQGGSSAEWIYTDGHHVHMSSTYRGGHPDPTLTKMWTSMIEKAAQQ
jgi:hypothetical protein